MPTQMGNHIPVARVSLNDNANIEQAFEYFWEGWSDIPGAEDEIQTLKNDVENIRSMLLNGETTTDIALDSSKLVFRVPINNGGYGHFKIVGLAYSTPDPINYSIPQTATQSDTFVFENTQQTLQLKTLISPTITNRLTIGSLGTIESGTYEIIQFTQNLTNTLTQIHEFESTKYRSGEYIISASTADNRHYACKILFVQNGTNMYISPYGEISTDPTLSATFDGLVALVQGKTMVRLFMQSTIAVSIKVQAVMTKV